MSWNGVLIPKSLFLRFHYGWSYTSREKWERETTYLKSILEALLKRLLRQIVLKDFYSKLHCWLACCCFSARKSKEIIRPPSCAFEVVHLLLLLRTFSCTIDFWTTFGAGFRSNVVLVNKYVVNIYVLWSSVCQPP